MFIMEYSSKHIVNRPQFSPRRARAQKAETRRKQGKCLLSEQGYREKERYLGAAKQAVRYGGNGYADINNLANGR